MKNDFKVGIFFTAIGQYSNILIQFMVTVVLSRLLTPEDFGVVAIIQVFLVLFQILATAGMGPAIIQNKKLTDKDYGVLVNYSGVLSIILGLVFGIVGVIVSHIYDNPEFVALFWWMDVVVVAECLNTVPNAILSKEKNFKALNIRLVIANVFGAIFGIGTALLGMGVYALIISVAIPAIVTLICNFIIVRIKWTTSFSLAPLKAVFGFAKNQFISTILNYFSRNLDNMLVGKYFGPDILGYYSKSYQLLVLPNMAISQIVAPVLQPILSHYEEDISVIKDAYFKIINFLAVLAFPISFFMCLNADKIIYFLFGKQWQGAILPLSILSLSIWAQLLSNIYGNIMQSRNQSKLLMRTVLIQTVITILSIILGVLSQDILKLSMLVAFAYSINFFVANYILMKYTLKDKFRNLLKILLKPFLGGIVSAIIIVISNPFTDFDSYFICLLSRGAIWLAVIFVYLIVTGEIKSIKSFFGK